MSKKSARHIGLSVSVAALACVAASSAFAADPAPKWCQGVKIAAFPGGPQGGVFANNVYNGFKQAELDSDSLRLGVSDSSDPDGRRGDHTEKPADSGR